MYGLDLSPEELAEYQLGQLIAEIGRITYESCMEAKDAIEAYQRWSPILDPMQKDAFRVVIDELERAEREDIAC